MCHSSFEQTWRAHVSCSLTAILNLNGIVMPNDIPPVDAMSDELHLFCSICLSIFLPDTPPEAEAVATPCGTSTCGSLIVFLTYW